MNHRLENEKVSPLLFSLSFTHPFWHSLQHLFIIWLIVFIFGRLPLMVVYPLQELVYVHQLLQSLLLLVIFFGRGGAPLLPSIKLGEKNPKEVERILGNAFSSLIF